MNCILPTQKDAASNLGRFTSGLTHLGARDYDPLIGRFTSTDPLMNLTDPQQWNGYSYANNNPTTNSDPSGLMLPAPDTGPPPARPDLPDISDPKPKQPRLAGGGSGGGGRGDVVTVTQPRRGVTNVGGVDIPDAVGGPDRHELAARVQDYLPYARAYNSYENSELDLALVQSALKLYCDAHLDYCGIDLAVAITAAVTPFAGEGPGGLIVEGIPGPVFGGSNNAGLGGASGSKAQPPLKAPPLKTEPGTVQRTSEPQVAEVNTSPGDFLTATKNLAEMVGGRHPAPTGTEIQVRGPHPVIEPGLAPGAGVPSIGSWEQGVLVTAALLRVGVDAWRRWGSHR